MTRTDRIREYLKFLDEHGLCDAPINWDELKKIAITDEEKCENTNSNQIKDGFYCHFNHNI